MQHISPLCLTLQDTEWPMTAIAQQRTVVRAIVVTAERQFLFVQGRRDDMFGRVRFLETAGGGVEAGESLCAALHRELREELGAEVDIVCKLGEVHDAYHLLQRQNHNHYYLCRVRTLGRRHLMQDEKQVFHLQRCTLSYEQAVATYTQHTAHAFGRLLAQRELPILRAAWQVLQQDG